MFGSVSRYLDDQRDVLGINKDVTLEPHLRRSVGFGPVFSAPLGSPEPILVIDS